MELTDIVRKANPVVYRKTYTATAVISHGARQPESKRIEFSIEHTAVGPLQIRAKFIDDIDYPLAPAISALSTHISNLQRDGELP